MITDNILLTFIYRQKKKKEFSTLQYLITQILWSRVQGREILFLSPSKNKKKSNTL